MERHEILTILADAPTTMAEALVSLARAASPLPASPAEWGVGDVIRHMRAADAIISQRLWVMLLREDTVVWAFDEREWGRLIAAADRPLADQIESFRLRRAELVAMLRVLSDEQWERISEHEINGTMTLLDVARTLAEHEAEHCAQLKALTEPNVS